MKEYLTLSQFIFLKNLFLLNYLNIESNFVSVFVIEIFKLFYLAFSTASFLFLTQNETMMMMVMVMMMTLRTEIAMTVLEPSLLTSLFPARRMSASKLFLVRTQVMWPPYNLIQSKLELVGSQHKTKSHHPSYLVNFLGWIKLLPRNIQNWINKNWPL